MWAWLVCRSQRELNNLKVAEKAASRLSSTRMDNPKLKEALAMAREWSSSSSTDLVLQWGDPYLANQQRSEMLKYSFREVAVFWFVAWTLSWLFMHLFFWKKKAKTS